MTDEPLTASAGPATAEALPLRRATRFHPPEELARLRGRHPVSHLVYPDGHRGWLVTGYDAVRAVLADQRFSARRDKQHFPVRHPLVPEQAPPPPPGAFPEMDPPHHTRYRALLTREFTAHRMRALAPRIEEIVRGQLDLLEKAGPVVDLHEAFGLTVPALVICELLGVPYDRRDDFQEWALRMISTDVTPEEAGQAYGSLRAFVQGLVAEKQAAGSEDLLGRLAASGELTEEELTTIALGLLFAGHALTGNMLSLGVFALLEHPELLAELRADGARAGAVVDELMRFLSLVHFGPVRVALEDVEVAGVRIAAGESVTLSLPAANRDPARYAEPDALRPGREHVAAHVGFGHGIHHCLGQELARIQLRAGYRLLFERLPSLRLAVPAAEVPMQTEMPFYGVFRLPVTWDQVPGTAG
ncbi:cytochrome P450 [Streptomyces carpaticus]|uniref:cytochrome P450 n=1 Tax=Streptomyces carpaticus TaxID=285558 RepID=UPI00220FD94D|nr:cytochrome P450 [Streptomyces carpaticus]